MSLRPAGPLGASRNSSPTVSVVKTCTTLPVFGSISAFVSRTSIPVMLLISRSRVAILSQGVEGQKHVVYPFLSLIVGVHFCPHCVLARCLSTVLTRQSDSEFS